MPNHGSGSDPATGSVLRTRLRRGLVAQVTWEGPRRDLLVRGIRSERTVRSLSRAVASWHTFDRYDRVSLDLSTLPSLSAELAEFLADDARRARAAGRRLDFVPPLDAADGRRQPAASTRRAVVSASNVGQVHVAERPARNSRTAPSSRRTAPTPGLPTVQPGPASTHLPEGVT